MKKLYIKVIPKSGMVEIGYCEIKNNKVKNTEMVGYSSVLSGPGMDFESVKMGDYNIITKPNNVKWNKQNKLEKEKEDEN